MDKKNTVSKTSAYYEFPDLKELRKTGSEQEIIDWLEVKLKDLIQVKKKIKAESQAQIEKINKWFEEELQKLTRFENQMILLWDFHQREVEILNLEKELEDKSLSPEEKEIARKKKNELIYINTNLAEGYKKKEIDKERLIELRKKLGAWEE
jgi:hypothetical protein